MVLKPLQEEEFKGKPAIAICIHGDSAYLGEPSLVCEMMTRTMELGKQNLALNLKYGEANLKNQKKQLRVYQSKRTGGQLSTPM